MGNDIKLKNQKSVSVPKINGIDMLANARPIKLNNIPKKDEPIKKEENKRIQVNQVNKVGVNTVNTQKKADIAQTKDDTSAKKNKQEKHVSTSENSSGKEVAIELKKEKIVIDNELIKQEVQTSKLNVINEGQNHKNIDSNNKDELESIPMHAIDSKVNDTSKVHDISMDKKDTTKQEILTENIVNENVKPKNNRDSSIEQNINKVLTKVVRKVDPLSIGNACNIIDKDTKKEEANNNDNDRKYENRSNLSNVNQDSNKLETINNEYEDNKQTTLQYQFSKHEELTNVHVNVDELDFSITKKVRAYLKKLINVGGSDLHLKAGSKIRARIHGDIVIFSDEIFTKDNAILFAKELTRGRFHELTVNKELDMTYIYDSNIRFRVNVFFQMEGVSFAFRMIPTNHSTIKELGLPDSLNKIVNMERGLVLVTGVTGSGKSTTLAAIINEINQRKSKHIITIEDPIEFVHQDAKSMINQRSVGMDTNGFASALKAALREDPDIILVGEMRDVETIEMALHAAETGHLVLSTLHTLDAKETINRIVSVFPANSQAKIRSMLASTLSAIVSQRLLKSKNGGRVAAVELLFKTPRIELIINESRDEEIMEALYEGKEIYHTQTFDQHLFDLITGGVVDEEVAIEKATSPSDLRLKLQNINFDQPNTEETIAIKN